MSCQSCEGCNSCVSCQGCHGCNSCDECQSCNTTCDGPVDGCLSNQSFCSISDQLVSTWDKPFSWGVSVNSDSLFFSNDTWNKIITYINNARAEGSEKSSGLSAMSKDDEIFMTAEKFNEVSAALFNLGGNTSSYPQRTVYAVGSKEKPEGDIVYGSYFSELADQANHLKYKQNQCDQCNTACNNCNECQNCNTCQSGNTADGTCDSGNTSYSCCEATTT